MISVAGLFIIDVSIFRSMAIGTIGVIFISIIGSLTFLPATLAILGDRVNLGRIPFFGRVTRRGKRRLGEDGRGSSCAGRSGSARRQSCCCSSSRCRGSIFGSG